MDRVGNLLDRPKLYYNIDGVGELGIGFMCLSYALLAWTQIHSPPHSVWHSVHLLFLFVGAMCAVIHYGSKAIKAHITGKTPQTSMHLTGEGRKAFVQYRRKLKSAQLDHPARIP